jgi:hypothetical protein
VLRIDGELDFSVTPPRAEDSMHEITGRVIGDGAKVQVHLEPTPGLGGFGDLRAVRVLARGLAAEGLSLSVETPDGILVTLGTTRRSLLSRMLLRSRHVRLGPVRNLLRMLRPGRRTYRLSDLLPPKASLPS